MHAGTMKRILGKFSEGLRNNEMVMGEFFLVPCKLRKLEDPYVKAWAFV